MTHHIHLAKASDDLVSHCKCASALAGYPAQMDCPWCGCGWLFICLQCQKAFTFAQGVLTDEPWEELAHRDLSKRYGREPSAEEMAEWLETMKALFEDIQVGQSYVYLDGVVVPADDTAICFDGAHSRHDLGFVPQAAALNDPSISRDILESREYWQSTAIAEEEP